MVKKIVHLADIHIPNDTNVKPFSDMVKRMAATVLEKIKDYPKDEVRIVISGDIFNQKIKTSNEAQSVFHELLNYFNAFCKTVIIAGNHDMLENNISKKDSITPTFEIKNVYPNITFADRDLGYKSGYLVDDGVIWVLYSIFDKFAKPNMDNLRENYPEHKIVGLFHGEVPGAVTDTGWTSENGIDTDLFKDCDCVMAGHIHKFQEIRKNGVPIVYCGSTFQQNLGENVSGHGFLIWDLDTMEYTHYEVENDYSVYKFEVTSYEDVENNTEILLNA